MSTPVALMLAMLGLVGIAGAPQVVAAPSGARSWQEGVNYERITPPPQPIATTGGSIQVIEFFGYWCPHCRAFEPFFEAWSKGVPKDVNVVRVPVIWEGTKEPETRNYASLYYTLEALARPDLQTVFFDAVHAHKKAGQGKLASFMEQQTFAVQNGIEAQSFERIYHSEAVREKVERAARMTSAYAIVGTPTMTVQGAYRCDPDLVGGGFEEFLNVVDYLTQRVRAETVVRGTVDR